MKNYFNRVIILFEVTKKMRGVPVMSTPRLGNPLETDTLLLQLNSDRLAAMWTNKRGGIHA